MTIGGAQRDVVAHEVARDAAWMSAAGSKRVNVVHRKFIALARGAPRLVGEDDQRPAREGRDARRARCAASGSARVGRPADHEAAAAEDAHVGDVRRDGDARRGTRRGSSRTGSPRPSHTPFEPSFTAGPV